MRWEKGIMKAQASKSFSSSSSSPAELMNLQQKLERAQSKHEMEVERHHKTKSHQVWYFFFSLSFFEHFNLDSPIRQLKC